MPGIIAERLNFIKPSPIFAMSAQATKLKAEGKDIISLTIGEPDFNTPDNIKMAGIAAIEHDLSHYTPTSGTPSLKKAIVAKFARENQLNYKPEQIIVSTGAKQCLYNACFALLNDGDEVIIPAPYWVSYLDMTVLAGGKPVVIQTNAEQHYKITAQQLADAITPKTKLLFLNSPSNPTGMVYTHAELKAIAEVLLQHPHVIILSDDIYERNYWSREPFANLPMICPELLGRTIVINGVSKTYAMTGWRIGYAAGPTDIIKAMDTLQSQCTSNACSISQAAAEAALNGTQTSVTDMNLAYQRRLAIAIAGVKEINGFSCQPTQGAFYLFIDVSQAMQKQGIADDVAFSSMLLNQAEVAVVPGSAFGTPNHIRISYATSDELLKEALHRIKNTCNKN